MGSCFALFLFDSLEVLFGCGVFAFEQWHDLAKGPLEVAVAHLPAWRSVVLARRSVTAANQSSVRQEVSNFGESFDVVDFIQQRHRNDLADTGDGFEQIEYIGVVDFGGLFKERF